MFVSVNVISWLCYDIFVMYNTQVQLKFKQMWEIDNK